MTTHAILRIIREEHAALLAMLRLILLRPLTGREPAPDDAALFTRIVNLVPAPVGLGT